MVEAAAADSGEQVMEIAALMEFIEQEAESLSNIYFEDNVIAEPPATVQVAKHVLTPVEVN